MAQSRTRQEWNRTADLMALIANVNKGKDTPAFTRERFHPMMQGGRKASGVRLTPEVLRAQRARFSR